MNNAQRNFQRVPAEERVFSLLLALVASPQGLTKTQLLSSVYGYADRYQAGADTSSIERQFERDKDQIRAFGVRIETIDSPEAVGDNKLTRYRIEKTQLQLPESVRFTSEELTVLRLAALSWAEGSLGDHSQWARLKVDSLGSAPQYQRLGVAPKIDIAEPCAQALLEAINNQVVVSFDYRVPEHSEPLKRKVAPLRLHRIEGRWHLLAWDTQRDATRVFLLKRITSAVSVSSETFSQELFNYVPDLIVDTEKLATEQPARVLVAEGSAAEARLSARAAQKQPDQSLSLSTLDYWELAAELASYGDEAIALEPQLLRERTIKLLEGIEAQHANEPGGVEHG